MPLGELLYGLAKGGAEEVTKRHDDTRRREDLALEAKRAQAQTILEAIVNGRGDPKWAGPLLADMDATMDPSRKSVGGWRGFFGASEQPSMPTLDALTSSRTPLVSLPNQPGVLYSPEQNMEQAAKLKSYGLGIERRSELTDLQNMLEPMGYDRKEIGRIAMSNWFRGGAYGANGSVGDYWDEDTQEAFRGRADILAGGVIDVTTGQVRRGKPMKLSRSTDMYGNVTVTNDLNGQIVHTYSGIGNPRMWMVNSPQTGTSSVVTAAQGAPGGFNQTAAMKPAGQPSAPLIPRPEPATPPMETNPAWEKAKDARDTVLRQLNQMLADDMEYGLLMREGDLNAVEEYVGDLRDRIARQLQWPDWATIIAAVNANESQTRRPGPGGGLPQPSHQLNEPTAPVANPMGPNQKTDIKGQSYGLTPTRPPGYY